MECRPLTITLESAEDLEDVRKLSTMRVYAVVSVGGNMEKKTPVDETGGTNPKWNCSINFLLKESDVQQNRRPLVINLLCERTFAKDKFVAQVSISIKDLLKKYGNRRSAQTGRYMLYNISKKPKGILNFTYKFGKKVTLSPPPKQSSQGSCSRGGQAGGVDVQIALAFDLPANAPLDLCVDPACGVLDGSVGVQFTFEADMAPGCSADDNNNDGDDGGDDDEDNDDCDGGDDDEDNDDYDDCDGGDDDEENDDCDGGDDDDDNDDDYDDE